LPTWPAPPRPSCREPDPSSVTRASTVIKVWRSLPPGPLEITSLKTGPGGIVGRVGITLDFADLQAEATSQHYAFLVSEAEFDTIFARIVERGLPYWADPFHREPGKINTNDGGRGVYWDDPNGHSLEILTVPYGGW
jgi:hypothetical protein